METIYSSKYSKHTYDANNSLLFSYWDITTEDMSKEEFRAEMIMWRDVFRQVKPKYLLDDCVNFSYPIIQKEQIWMVETLYNEWIQLGLQKYAHLVPAEYITEISTEQLFEEFSKKIEGNKYPIVNFSSKKEALAWLLPV